MIYRFYLRIDMYLFNTRQQATISIHDIRNIYHKYYQIRYKILKRVDRSDANVRVLKIRIDYNEKYLWIFFFITDIFVLYVSLFL